MKHVGVRSDPKDITSQEQLGGGGDFKKDGSVQMTGALRLANQVSVSLSGSTLELGTAASNFVVTSDSGAISYLNGPPAQAGLSTIVRFDSVRTIRHSDASLKLPGARDIVTQIGDTALFRYKGPVPDAWECLWYTRADGTALASGAGFTEQQVRSTPMTGVTLTDKTAVVATDTLLIAIGKLQAQLNNGLFRKESITAGSVGKTSWAVPGGYTAGAILVILNGALLDAADYIATDGINITGVTSTNARDVMNVIVFGVLRAQDDALLSYTVAQLNTQGAAANALKVRWCSNANGGACMVVSNGTNWVRVADNAILTV